MGNKRDCEKHIETEEWATAKGGAWAPREAGSAGLSERRASLACRTFRERGEPRPAHSAVSSPRALCSFHLQDTLANGLRVPPSLNQETGGGPAEPSWPVGTRSQSETARFRRPCSADCRARLGCRHQTCRPAKSRGRCSWSVSPLVSPGKGWRRTSRETRGLCFLPCQLGVMLSSHKFL